MPIRSEDRHHYSAASGWGKLRLLILERAKGCCERCGLKNHATGWRDSLGRFHKGKPRAGQLAKPLKIVLTIAHLDQDPANRDHANLAALCQKCHLAHDSQQHADNAARTRAKKRQIVGQMSLDLYGEPLT